MDTKQQNTEYFAAMITCFHMTCIDVNVDEPEKFDCFIYPVMTPRLLRVT